MVMVVVSGFRGFDFLVGCLVFSITLVSGCGVIRQRADSYHSSPQPPVQKMTSSRTRRPSWERRSMIMLVIGILLGQLTYHIITSLLRRGQHFPCTLPNFGPNEGISTQETDSADSTKRLLFVGVMTSRKYLHTRARAVYTAWGSLLNGSLMFFVGDGDKVDEKNLPVQILDSVKDTDYPPHRKAFAMLEFMHRKYGHRYEWFMRADDDVFMDVRRMTMLLSSLNSSVPLYIGHPGTGKPEEAGRLGLPDGVPYCMGGTGVVLSSALLTSLASLVGACVQNKVTSHEDSEVGRCVYNASGQGCLQSKKIYPRFKQSYDDTSGQWIRKALRSSQPYVTFHPVKDTSYMYDSAVLVAIQRVTELEAKVRQLTTSLSCMDAYLDLNDTEMRCTDEECARMDITRCGLDPQRAGHNRFEKFNKVSWFLIHQMTFYTFWKNDLIKPVSFGGIWEGLTKAIRHLSAYVKAKVDRHSRNTKLVVSESFYQRVIPAAGVEYMAFVRDTSSNYVHPYVIRQSFDDLDFIQK